MAKLDDFLARKKETTPILDLSKTTPQSSEEFRRLLEKIPEFKIKSEKVLAGTVKIKEKIIFSSRKHGAKEKKEKYAFMDPVPLEMKKLHLEDLTSVSIDWKMLTNLRPKSKVEENYYSRMVELGKLKKKSRLQTKRQIQLDPQVTKIKNKSGVVETRIISCTECGEDFCNGKTCSKYGYDSFTRSLDVATTSDKAVSSSLGTMPATKTKRLSRSKNKAKRQDKRRSMPMKKNRSKLRK